MSQMFKYPCPDCRTTQAFHHVGCKYDHMDPVEFEQTYIDILSVLLEFGAIFAAHDMDQQGISYEKLKDKVGELRKFSIWTPKHDDCFTVLKEERRIANLGRGWIVLEPAQRAEQIIPMFEPLRTIFEHGPVNGAKDYAVYTMVSWTALKELSWEQAKNFLTEWLEASGAWERESWGESSIEELLNSKSHVHANNLGWGEYADIAKQTIDESGVEAQIDATEWYGQEPDTYDT